MTQVTYNPFYENLAASKFIEQIRDNIEIYNRTE